MSTAELQCKIGDSRNDDHAPNKGAAANRHLAGQSDGSDNLSAIIAVNRAFPVAVAELCRSTEKMNERLEHHKVRTLERIEGHLSELKWLIVLLIATVAFPPIAWVFLILAGIMLISALFGAGLASVINRMRK
jgi:hypothetical protein